MAKRARKPAKRPTATRRKAAIPKKKSARPKAAKLKPHASKGAKPKSAKSKPDMARLERELRIARDRQAATSDILRVISQSPNDVRPVFEAIVLAAVRLIHCDLAFFLRCDGTVYSGTARATPEGLQSDIRPPQSIDPEANFPSRAILAKRTLHLPDWSLIELPDNERQVHEKFGINCALYVPMLRDGECIGLLTLAGKRANSFGENEIALAESFRDQALIAIENARLFNVTQEALERQTATAGILKVIASSPSDAQPVFDAIAGSSKRLIGGFSATVFRFIDGNVNLVAYTPISPAADDILKASFPRPAANLPLFELAKGGKVVQEPDSETNPDAGFRNLSRARGFRSSLFAPLMNKETPIGVISVTRKTPGLFAAHHIELLQTFADQAVIAIENARLFNETQEALERQTATADILKVIASSPSDVQPVFEAIAERSNRLINGLSTAVYSIVDDTMHLMAFTRMSPEADATLQASFPRPVSEVPWAAQTRKGDIVEIPDAEAEWAERPDVLNMVRMRGFRSLLFVPLQRNGTSIGVIGVSRKELGRFAPHHVQLLQTFADQAVIAIGNVRLFDEVQAKTKDLTEALAYQTGSSNVLRVIASSPTDVDPVLKAIVESARELCEANDAIALLKDGENLRFSAHSGPIAVMHDRWPINRNWTAGRAFVDQKPVHVHDMLSEEGAEFPVARAMGQTTGSTIHTVLSVPLLRGDESIGAILLRRTEVRPFTEKQVDLLSTFADQAVIAIQNARMFNETREALEQQKASADILNVISNSVAETQPVFDEILRSVARLFGSQENFIFLVGEDGLLHVGAGSGPRVEQVRGLFPTPLDGTVSQVAIRERRLVRSAHVFNDPELPLAAREGYRRLGENYSMVVAPMLWEDRAIGSIMVARTSMTPFSEKECTLLSTFADQAVIAIQNARLFNETREALERQTATAEILKVIASSPDDVQPVFQAIAERSNHLVGGFATTVVSIIDDVVHLSAFTPTTPAADAALRAFYPRPLSGFTYSDAVRKGDIHRIVDTEVELAGESDQLTMVRQRGWRSALWVPLLLEGEAIGVIGVTRVEPGPFADHYVEMLKTFADQAVIAISNVKLFRQVQERTRELSQSLDDLRTAQDRLVQTEKLASLGQLTAGIAHEIKNPLNFVNNFSALSAELTDELNDLLKPAPLDAKMRGEADELTGLIKANLEKVVQHGKRADSIVKNMLLHSREGSGEQRPTDINALLDESLNLAYHGARAEKPGFNITLQRDFDEGAGSIEGFPQEITRAFLNLISNGFYAATKRWADNGEADFEPQLSATTKDLGGHVEIRIRDNGTGIPPEVKEKMFNPFFTTKPAGEGTGLGLSMSHDIIVKQHGGRIDVTTEPGRFTEFTVLLPRTIRK
jgi:GAF domain-containing protein